MTVLLPLPAAIPGWCVSAIVVACCTILAALILWRLHRTDHPACERGWWDCARLLDVDSCGGGGHVRILHHDGDRPDAA